MAQRPVVHADLINEAFEEFVRVDEVTADPESASRGRNRPNSRPRTGETTVHIEIQRRAVVSRGEVAPSVQRQSRPAHGSSGTDVGGSRGRGPIVGGVERVCQCVRSFFQENCSEALGRSGFDPRFKSHAGCQVKRVGIRNGHDVVDPVEDERATVFSSRGGCGPTTERPVCATHGALERIPRNRVEVVRGDEACGTCGRTQRRQGDPCGRKFDVPAIVSDAALDDNRAGLGWGPSVRPVGGPGGAVPRHTAVG